MNSNWPPPYPSSVNGKPLARRRIYFIRYDTGEWAEVPRRQWLGWKRVMDTRLFANPEIYEGTAFAKYTPRRAPLAA